MVAFIQQTHCIRCNKKTKKLKQLWLEGHMKQIDKANILMIKYSPSFYLCKSCIKSFYSWIKKETQGIKDTIRKDH